MTATADSLKQQGNTAFAAGKFEDAIEHFSRAIDLDGANHVLFSNRSASQASLKRFDLALDDAEKAIALKPDWPKGYSRKGAALHGLGKLADAVAVYKEGLAQDPENALLKRAVEETEQELRSPKGGAGDGGNPLAQMFAGDIWSKLGSNPSTMPFLAQPDYVQKIKDLQANPGNLQQYMSDPRIMQSLGVLLGVNISTTDAPQPTETTPQDEAMPEQAKKEASPSKPKAETAAASAPPPSAAAEPTPAQKEKEQGNTAYKARRFEEALAHYEAAWSLDSTDITYLNNKAAVLFEMGRYDDCIATCDDAVEKGRELRADYKLVARALGRAGNAYMKKDDVDAAIKSYQKSMSEHRTPEFQAKLKEAEKVREANRVAALYSPEKAEEHRNAGNEKFKADLYADAVKEYTTAITHNPKDPRIYSNRAACFTKLMALPSALKDCETCLQLDAHFAKAYIRKANVLFSMKEYTKCMETCDAGLAANLDEKSMADLNEWKMKANMAVRGTSAEERRKTAMKDPAVMAILQDPVMSQILQDMQNDPSAIREHTKNPEVVRKLQVLANAGFIEMR